MTNFTLVNMKQSSDDADIYYLCSERGATNLVFQALCAGGIFAVPGPEGSDNASLTYLPPPPLLGRKQIHQRATVSLDASLVPFAP